MSYSLAKLLACGSTAVLHGYTPQDVGEVKLDLEVSVVGDWKATEDSGAAPCWVAVSGQSSASTWFVVSQSTWVWGTPSPWLIDSVPSWAPAGYHEPTPVSVVAWTVGIVIDGSWRSDASGPLRPTSENVTVKSTSSFAVEVPFKFSRMQAGRLGFKRLSLM